MAKQAKTARGNVRITFETDQASRDRLDAYCGREGRTITFIFNRMLQEFLEEHEPLKSRKKKGASNGSKTTRTKRGSDS